MCGFSFSNKTRSLLKCTHQPLPIHKHTHTHKGFSRKGDALGDIRELFCAVFRAIVNL